MYKVLLCWRYLRTRWIALASIISVTLGVATMIVVNSVMEGFRHEMQERIHGILSDVVFESNSLVGFIDPDWHMEQIRKIAGDYIEGMTATVVVPAMLSYQHNDVWITRPVQLIGIDERTQSQVGDFCKYLQHPANREHISFDLREDGYDIYDHQAGPDALPRADMAEAGWLHRRKWVEHKRLLDAMQPRADRGTRGPGDPFAAPDVFDPPRELVPTESATLEPISLDDSFAVKSAGFAAEPGVAESTADESRLPPPRLAKRFHATNQRPSTCLHAAASRMTIPTRCAACYLPNLIPGNSVDASDISAQAPETGASPDPAAMPSEPPPLTIAARDEESAAAVNPFAQFPAAGESFDPATSQNPGAVVGIALVNYRDPSGHDRFLGLPGDDVQISFPRRERPPR